MSVVIELDPTEETLLSEEARRKGLSLQELTKGLIRDHLRDSPESSPHTRPNSMFREWEAEDANMTPEEIEAEDRLWEQFHLNLNETRRALGMRQL